MLEAPQNNTPHFFWLIFAFKKNVSFSLFVIHELFEQRCSIKDRFHHQVGSTLDMYCHWEQNSHLRQAFEAD